MSLVQLAMSAGAGTLRSLTRILYLESIKCAEMSTLLVCLLWSAILYHFHFRQQVAMFYFSFLAVGRFSL